MKAYDDTIEKIKNRLTVLSKRATKISKEMHFLNAKLVRICLHEDTEKKSQYYEGGYLIFILIVLNIKLYVKLVVKF